MQTTQQMIAIPATLAGATADAEVTLNIHQGLAVIPDVIAFDNAAFDYVSLVGTTLTVINNGAAEGTTNVWLIYFHSIERSYGNRQTTQLNPAPFVIRGAGGGGSTSLEVVAKMTSDAGQEVANNTPEPVEFAVTEYESPAGVADPANDQFIIPIAGTYIITAMVTWAATGADVGTMRLTVRIDGAGSATAQQTMEVAGQNVARTSVVSTAMQLAAGALVTFLVDQLTGDAQDILFCEATISRVGPGGPIGPIII